MPSGEGTKPHHPAGKPLHNPQQHLDRSYEWEENYRRRVRTMNRDYVNPISTRIVDHHGRHDETSTPGTPQRTRRWATDGPLILENSNPSAWGSSPSAHDEVGLSQQRGQSLNLFFPTEDEVRARITYEVKHPSQLPIPSISSFTDDYQDLIGSSLGNTTKAMGRPNRNQTIVSSRNPSELADHHVSEPLIAPDRVVPKRHDYNFLKNSLIMFGDDTSNGTGLSEQELLHRKQKEEIKARFKAYKHQRNRMVTLPSTLLGRQQSSPGELRQGPRMERLSSNSVEREYQPPQAQGDIRRRRDVNPRVTESDPLKGQAREVRTTSNDIQNREQQKGVRWMINPSLSRSRSRSQSPVFDDNETGAFPSPYREVRRDRVDESRTSLQQDANTIGNTSGPDSAYVKQKRPTDPPSRRKQPVKDYDYSLDDSAGWDDQLAMKIMNVVHRPGDVRAHREVDVLETIHRNEESWPDPGMVSQLDDSEEAEDEEGLNGNQFGRFPSPDMKVLHYEKNRANIVEGNNPSSAFGSPSTPTTASMTYEASNDDMAAVFDPFQGPDPSTASSPTRRNRRGISRSIDDLLAATTTASTTPSSLPTTSGYATSTLLNNPPGLNMDEYAPNKPDAPATAVATSRDRAQIVTPNVRWSENLEQQRTPRRTMLQKPKSILRQSRIRSRRSGRTHSSAITRETNSFRSPVVTDKAMETSRFGLTTELDASFLGEDGRILSPITGDDGGIEVAMMSPTNYGASAFERNIPLEFQQAFAEDSKDHFGEISPTYTEFIEAVACVVIQTCARRFLASIRVQKLLRIRSEAYDNRRVSATTRSHDSFPVASRQKSQNPQLNMFVLAAIRIQAIFRGWHSRDCIAVDHYCATIVQQAYRRYHAENRFTAMVYCAVAIQAAFRGRRVRQLTSLYRQPEGMDLLGYTLQRSQGIDADTFRHPSHAIQHLAATSIQSHARSWITRKVIRFWLRSSRTQTTYLFKSQSMAKKSQAKDPHSLPQSYHAHAAFMQQSVHKRPRSSSSTSVHKAPLDPVFMSSDDGELDSCHDQIDGETAQLTKQDQRNDLIKTGTYEYRRDRSTQVLHLEATPARLVASTEANQDAQSASGPVRSSQKREGGAHDVAKSRSQVHSWAPPTPRTIPLQKASHLTPKVQPDAMLAMNPHPIPLRPTVIDSSSGALPSNVRSSWKDREAHSINPPKDGCGQSENFQRHIRDASNATTEKPAWMVKLAKKTSPREPVVTVKDESIPNSVVDSADSNTQFDPTARLKKTETTNKFQAPSLQKQGHAPTSSASQNWQSRLRATTNSIDGNGVISRATGQEKLDQVSDTLPGSTAPEVPHRAVEDADVRDEKKPFMQTQRHAPTAGTAENWQSRLRTTTKSTHENGVISREIGQEKRDPASDTLPESTASHVPPRVVKGVEVRHEKKDDYVPLEPEQPSGKCATSPKMKPASEVGATLSIATPSLRKPAAGTELNLDASPPMPLVVPVDAASKSERLPLPVGSPLKSASPVHVTMRNRRSESEQRRVDTMHHIFLRNGLIGRREKEVVSFANISSAEYQANHDNDVRTPAKDLIHAWKDSDQTQPLMTGKLF